MKNQVYKKIASFNLKFKKQKARILDFMTFYGMYKKGKRYKLTKKHIPNGMCFFVGG